MSTAGATLMTEADIVKAMDEAYLNTTPHGDAMRAALRIALPWAREQALREAATVSWNMHAGIYVRDAILALIPSRPSQGGAPQTIQDALPAREADKA